MNLIQIENWSVVTMDPYSPPEWGGYLHGNVFNHPVYPDGSELTTSLIVDAEGRVVTTYSGNKYRLGAISGGYLDYLNNSGQKYDHENPVRVKKL